MPVAPLVSEDALLNALLLTCVALAAAAILVWICVFGVRVRRLRRFARETADEEKLTALVLDRLASADRPDDDAMLARLPAGERRTLFRVLRRLIEQTRGDDRTHLARLLRKAGFQARAFADLAGAGGAQRQIACEILGYFDDERSTAALTAALRDRDTAVRLTAARALLQRDRIASLRELLAQLGLSRDDPPLILAEIFAHLPPSLFRETLDLLSADLPSEWLHMLAIAVGRRQIPGAFAPLAALRHSASPRVRAAAWVALRELGDPQTARLVGEGLADPSPHVRRAACRCAGALGGPDNVPPLVKLLRETDWWLAYEAALALLESGAEGRRRLEAHSRQTAPGDAGWQVWHETEADRAC